VTGRKKEEGNLRMSKGRVGKRSTRVEALRSPRGKVGWKKKMEKPGMGAKEGKRVGCGGQKKKSGLRDS